MPERDAVFAYSTGALELLREAAARGVPSVVDQLDPAQADEAAIYEEMDRWPGWAQHEGRIPSAYWDRLRAEWQSATAVLVNSEWSKHAVVTAGVPDSRVIVVPLAYEPEETDMLRLDEVGSGAELRVLWLGQVNLRKGFPYLVQAARLVQTYRIQFTVAGPIRLTARSLQNLPTNLRVLGHVSRAQALTLYKTSDVLVLPTLSDGFALTQLEAMAHCLPVVATDRCGDVVEDSVSGFRVGVRDPEAIAAALIRLESDRVELRRMSHAAVSRAAQFTLDRYVRSVDEGLAGVIERAGPS
ncbi:MAG: glycosyltransferase family 4 protein [Dehalococcoidales bacterium]|nr:glycosyltransferase family 4 protein [Dehalococcoidales bacterium]